MAAKTVKQLEAEIRRLKKFAYKDELTGVFNRRGFSEEVSRFLSELSFAKKYKDKRKTVKVAGIALVLFDLDRFKPVNDTYGHTMGDKALVFVSRTIRKRVRDIDIIGRWGGDEFALALVGASERAGVVVAGDILETLARTPFARAAGKKLFINASAGVAAFDGVSNLKTLVARADGALYKAKRAGRGTVRGS